MAEIVGCFAMSHAPQVMIDPDRWDLINRPRPTEPLAAELRNLTLEIDHTFIDAIQRNDRGQMEAMRSDDLVDGTSEIRCWVVAATAADRPATMLAYEPLPRVPDGNGVGMGVAEWDV